MTTPAPEAISADQGGPGDPPSYLDWSAAGRSDWWRYLLGTVIIVLFWIIVSSMILGVGMLLTGAGVNSDGSLTTDPQWLSLAITLLTFVPFFVATPLVVLWLLRRPALTVVTPFRRINWRIVGLGALAWVAATLVSSLPSLFARDEGVVWAFNAATFIPALIMACTLLFIQTTAEELFFRGYLLQWFGKRFRSVWFLSVVSGLLFTLPHLANPEVAGLAGAELLVGASPYFLIGFALAFVSVRSGTIELAIGAHFINNFIGVVFISASNSALGTTSLWVDNTPSITDSALGSLIATALFVGFTWRIRGSGELVPLPVATQEQPRGGVVAATVPTTGLPAAGWFPDPLGRATYRYWDGTRWTEHVG